jgi:hypothetical protein
VDVFIEPVLLIEHVQDRAEGLGHHSLLVGSAIGAEELLGVGTLRKEAFVYVVGELGFVLRDLDEVLFEQIYVNFAVCCVHEVALQ